MVRPDDANRAMRRQSCAFTRHAMYRMQGSPSEIARNTNAAPRRDRNSDVYPAMASRSRRARNFRQGCSRRGNSGARTHIGETSTPRTPGWPCARTCFRPGLGGDRGHFQRGAIDGGPPAAQGLGAACALNSRPPISAIVPDVARRRSETGKPAVYITIDAVAEAVGASGGPRTRNIGPDTRTNSAPPYYSRRNRG